MTDTDKQLADDPREIFLQPACCADTYGEGRLWCEHATEVGCDDGAKPTRYIRADLAEARTGGDALPHPVTPELIAGVGRGEVVAQGKAMDILEHLLSRPTPADDAELPIAEAHEAECWKHSRKEPCPECPDARIPDDVVGLVLDAHSQVTQTVIPLETENAIRKYCAEGGLTASGDARERALRDIAAERGRQVEVEGWTPEHDDEHGAGELPAAAACYALSSYFDTDQAREITFYRYWPWDRSWWKPSNDPRRDLVRAGALIVAEIERRDRAALLNTPAQEGKAE